MSLQAPTRDLLKHPQANPLIRQRIAAPPDKSLIYAGQFIRSAWAELQTLKQRDPSTADFELLSEILGDLPPPQGTMHRTTDLLAHV